MVSSTRAVRIGRLRIMTKPKKGSAGKPQKSALGQVGSCDCDCETSTESTCCGDPCYSTVPSFVSVTFSGISECHDAPAVACNQSGGTYPKASDLNGTYLIANEGTQEVGSTLCRFTFTQDATIICDGKDTVAFGSRYCWSTSGNIYIKVDVRWYPGWSPYGSVAVVGTRCSGGTQQSRKQIVDPPYYQILGGGCGGHLEYLAAMGSESQNGDCSVCTGVVSMDNSHSCTVNYAGQGSGGTISATFL